MEDSKIDTKYSHPQKAPKEHGPVCLSIIQWCGPTVGEGRWGEHGPWSLKGPLESSPRVGGRWLRASWEKGLASGQKKKQRMGWG